MSAKIIRLDACRRHTGSVAPQAERAQEAIITELEARRVRALAAGDEWYATLLTRRIALRRMPRGSSNPPKKQFGSA